jgi:hypothetical protein
MRLMYVRLSDTERAALCRYADRERRDPREQGAFMIRQALLACGALNADGTLPVDPRYDGNDKPSDS